MQIVSFVWGLLAALGTVIIYYPGLGALNWVNIPFAAAGVIVSVVIMAIPSNGGKSLALLGMVLCGFSTFMSILRLFIGAGTYA